MHTNVHAYMLELASDVRCVLSVVYCSKYSLPNTSCVPIRVLSTRRQSLLLTVTSIVPL